MSEERLIQQLREVIAGDEPAFTLTSQEIRHLRSRSRARRAVVVSALCVLLVAVGLVGVSAWRNGQADLDPAPPADFSPDKLKMAIAATADRVNAGRPAFVDTHIAAYDEQDRILEAADRVYATSWRGEFAWSSDHQLDVSLGHFPGEAEGDARDECEGELRLEYAISCEVTTGPDGVILQTTVRAAVRQRSGWPVAVPERHERLGDRLYFLQRVEARRGGALLASALEVVQTPSLEVARDRWFLSRADLVDIATDPALEFPAPPQVTPTGSEWSCDLPDGLARLAAEAQIDGEEVCQVQALREERKSQIREDPDGELSVYIEGMPAAISAANSCDPGGVESGEGSEADRLYCIVHKQIAAGTLRPTGTCGPPECRDPGTPVWHLTEPEIRRVAAEATGHRSTGGGAR